MMTVKIIQIACASSGDQESFDNDLYALDSDGVVHIWQDSTGKSGWRELGSLDTKYEKKKEDK